MNDDPLSDSGIVEHLLASDDESADLSDLADVLRDLRAEATAQPVGPDDRLVDLFDSRDAVPSDELRRRTWWRRPVVAFAAAFAGVLVFGVAALALVNRGSSLEPSAASVAPIAATTTTSSTAGPGIENDATLVAIPAAVGESVFDYVGCVLGKASDHLRDRLSDTTDSDRPRVLVECGAFEIPDLGPDAEEFRLELNEWLACSTAAFDTAFAEGFGTPGRSLNPIGECGPPPSPGDFGVTFDLDGLEGALGQLDLFDLDFDLDLDDLLGGFLENLPEDFPGRLPDDLELDRLRSFFHSFDGDFPHLDELLERLPPEMRDRIPDDLDIDGFNFFCVFGDGERLPDLLEGFLERLGDDTDLDLSDLFSWLSDLEPGDTPFELCDVS